MDRDNPRRWQLVRREAGIPDQEGGGAWWPVDHLLAGQDAVPTFAGVKRASDTRARREVVAQMLDYAANGPAFWHLGQLRGWFEGDDPHAATGHLVTWLDSADEDLEEVAARSWDAVGRTCGKARSGWFSWPMRSPPARGGWWSSATSRCHAWRCWLLRSASTPLLGASRGRWSHASPARPPAPKRPGNDPHPLCAARRGGPLTRCWSRSAKQGKKPLWWLR